MIKRHEVQVLLDAGFSDRQVAKKTGISKRSVTRIAQEPAVEGIDEAEVAAERRIGQPSVAGELRAAAEEILEEEWELPTIEILHRLRLRGYEGGKSAVYELVKSLQDPVPSRVMVRFEGLPGGFAGFDFGTVRAGYLSGEIERIHFAAYRLKYSRWVHVEVVPKKQIEPLSRSLVRAFEASEGLPLSVVFDNPKTVVLHPKKTPVVWNRTIAQLTVDFGFGIELCKPGRANQKCSLANLVGWVKGSFFKVRRFQDRADRLAQLTAWLPEVNDERPNRATGEIPAGSAPGGAEAAPTAGRHEATHPRFPKEDLSYPPDLRARHLASVSGKWGRLYFQSQRLLELGPVAEHFLIELIHQRPRTWKGDVEALYNLLERVGEKALLEALQAALLRGLVGGEYVRELARREVCA